MSRFQRYAVYVMPDGPLARFGAAWLGWDALSGRPVDHPVVAGLPRPLAEITAYSRGGGCGIWPPIWISLHHIPI